MGNTGSTKDSKGARPGEPEISREDVISEQVWGGRQTDNCTVTARFMGYLVRFHIHHDTSYASQGYAHAEVWSPYDLEWKSVHRMPGEELKSIPTPFTAKRPRISQFSEDLSELARVTAEVLAYTDSQTTQIIEAPDSGWSLGGTTRHGSREEGDAKD